MSDPIQLPMIDLLIDTLGPERVGVLLAALDGRVMDVIARLPGSGADVASEVHRLRGSCANMGLAGLAAALADADRGNVPLAEAASTIATARDMASAALAVARPALLAAADHAAGMTKR